MNTEAAHERYDDLDRWPPKRILEALVESSERAASAVRQALPQLEAAAEAVEARLLEGGRLVYAGAGTSGRLALLDASELYPTFGFARAQALLAGGEEAWSKAKEGAEDDEEAARQGVAELDLEPRDILIGLAASGRTPYTLAALGAAKERGALTVGIANNPGTPILDIADIGILLDTGPEVLAGSTRLAAGTAQKIALGALSTTVLVRLGGAYGNHMVGMRVVNDKLKGRAARIVQDATGAREAAAYAALEEAAWEIREAIVMLKLRCSLEEARRRLKETKSHVREALA